jgi:hypothetical protein
MKKLLLLLAAVPVLGLCQPEINSWIINNNGQLASFWLPSGNPPNVTYTYSTTTDSASVLKVCSSTDSVWIYSHGMVYNMGKYSNPGSCIAQTYIYRFPRNPQVAATKTISPKVGAIGCLTNGLPMYGLGDSKSWTGTTNSNMGGQGIWNVEVYMGEGVSLDTAFSAHPQQAGAYHSHANPRRLYQDVPTTQHSPIVGFAFDGYPVYGPYGYSNATDSTSAITRMKTGYALRNITTRTTLPYGVTASQTGPAVSSTYPIGTYCEDYEWSAANGGDLDKYNGRFCVTPEYPTGTYAYFVTIDAAGTPEFPYYVGIEYYGEPDQADLVALGSTSTGLTIPSGTACLLPTGVTEMKNEIEFTVYPNPSSGSFSVRTEANSDLLKSVQVTNMLGQVVYTAAINSEKTDIVLSSSISKGIYFVNMLDKNSRVCATEKITVE